MKEVPVKIYGLFGRFQGVEYYLDNNFVEQLEVEGFLDIDNHCYEIRSLFKTGSQLFINLRMIPNPHLYEPRPRWSLPAVTAS